MKHNPYDILRAFRDAGITAECYYEHRFHPTRQWRFDYAFPERMLYVEVDGGIWTGGAHARGSGLTRDYEKRNAATVLGWRGLWVIPQRLLSPEFLATVKSALA